MKIAIRYGEMQWKTFHAVDRIFDLYSAVKLDLDMLDNLE